jgi:hypothetical protein
VSFCLPLDWATANHFSSDKGPAVGIPTVCSLAFGLLFWSALLVKAVPRIPMRAVYGQCNKRRRGSATSDIKAVTFTAGPPRSTVPASRPTDFPQPVSSKNRRDNQSGRCFTSIVGRTKPVYLLQPEFVRLAYTQRLRGFHTALVLRHL